MLRDKKTVGYKRGFIVSFKVDDSIKRYKVRLVAKSFTHTYKIEYFETFVTMVKINLIGVLLSLAINSNWILH